jgi:N-acetyl-1-D-myo-inositol-2-amino-2-deoxy-alpha-D-glucopyranoside deacetylase
MPARPEVVLFVHAHPDDESLATGGTIATLVDAGATVTVLTCTRGELGEVVDPALAISGPAELALVRERELAAALAVLGVTDSRFLGSPSARWEGFEPRVYVDSGMQWGPNGAEPVTDVAPEALTQAEFGEVGADIATVIAELGPDAVISYDERGGYGHPDHVRTAAAARRAAEYMGVPYWSIVGGDAPADREVDATSVLSRKRAALLEYRSQLTVGPHWSAGANGEREPITAVERFRRELPVDEADTSYAAQSVPLKIFTLAVCVLLGAAAGLLFTAAHQSSLLVAILGVLAVAALLAGLRTVFHSRLVAAIAAGGLAIGELVLRFGSAASAELDRQNFPGVVWTWLPVLVVALVVALPGWGRRRRR